MSPTISHNLACYECQLGRGRQTNHWLEKAFELGHAKELTLMAMEEPDHESLWKDIGTT